MENIFKQIKEIGCTCLAWHFGRMQLAKGLSAAMDDPNSLLFESYCLKSEEYLEISKKDWLFQKNIEHLSMIPIMTWMHALFIVTLLKVLLLTETF